MRLLAPVACTIAVFFPKTQFVAFCANCCRYRRLTMLPSWNLVTAFSGMRMKLADEYPRMADEHMFRHDAPGLEFERDHLQRAKERQDKVHAALEVWIAAAIAELAARR